ncbi:hypothetical protein M378DRAFT_160211 [Amanita muscaria Koide BX008]|uniref:Uncharacterized protein n=1 Tax=Amanita muscaria (strain Koide BX008) TaxID=946122 RepID=A0A0C2XD14_AMAMK|nr:hypothetical protein M378DRAFT_160211 [Amanita muscaria Koide BX008]
MEDVYQRAPSSINISSLPSPRPLREDVMVRWYVVHYMKSVGPALSSSDSFPSHFVAGRRLLHQQVGEQAEEVEEALLVVRICMTPGIKWRLVRIQIV